MSKRNGADAHGRSFQIEHGNLTVKVPYSIFKGNTAVLDPAGERRFRHLLSSRYPWLTANALDVIVNNAREERERGVQEMKSVFQKARELIEKDRIEGALDLLDRHLKDYPDDAEALYAKGEALCRLGKREEGYRCISRARRLTEE
jgi:tetratricopeptide (TPR) repeat protein